jgi:nitrogenase molybdenum-iron protein NifN
MLRAGFPIHDRLGGANMGLVGYEAAHTLFEQIANLLIEQRQNASPVGYAYM